MNWFVTVDKQIHKAIELHEIYSKTLLFLQNLRIFYEFGCRVIKNVFNTALSQCKQKKTLI